MVSNYAVRVACAFLNFCELFMQAFENEYLSKGERVKALRSRQQKEIKMK